MARAGWPSTTRATSMLPRRASSSRCQGRTSSCPRPVRSTSSRCTRAPRPSGGRPRSTPCPTPSSAAVPKSSGRPDWNRMLLLISENQTGVHKVSPGLAIPQIGHLFSLNENNGHAVDKSDIGDQEYVWAGQNASLWEECPDSNPNAVLVTKGWHGHGQTRTFVVDAGANTVAEVMPNGRIRILAFIPNDRLRD